MEGFLLARYDSYSAHFDELYLCHVLYFNCCHFSIDAVAYNGSYESSLVVYRLPNADTEQCRANYWTSASLSHFRPNDYETRHKLGRLWLPGAQRFQGDIGCTEVWHTSIGGLLETTKQSLCAGAGAKMINWALTLGDKSVRWKTGRGRLHSGGRTSI